MGEILIKTYSALETSFAKAGLDKNCLHVVPAQENVQGANSIGLYSANPRDGGWQFVTGKRLTDAFGNSRVGENTGKAEERLRDARLQRIIETGEMLAQMKPGTAIAIKQHNAPDVILTIDENLLQSVSYNTASMAGTLWLFSTLSLKPDCFALSEMCTSQMIDVYLYQQICKKEQTAFEFRRLHSFKEIHERLDKAVE